MLRYRIVTFNIAHGRGLSPFQGLHGRRRFQRNLQKISKLLDELKPDIVALQEIDENSRWSGSFDHLSYLNALADFPHAVFGVNNRRTGGYQLNYGNAILSRHPIVAWENVTFGPTRSAKKVSCTLRSMSAGTCCPSSTFTCTIGREPTVSVRLTS